MKEYKIQIEYNKEAYYRPISVTVKHKGKELGDYHGEKLNALMRQACDRIIEAERTPDSEVKSEASI